MANILAAVCKRFEETAALSTELRGAICPLLQEFPEEDARPVYLAGQPFAGGVFYSRMGVSAAVNGRKARSGMDDDEALPRALARR